MRRLFPDVPPDHPAMGAMILNVSANMLGLGNAATPLGLKAMEELQTLNPRPRTATDAMVLFLAINTGSVQLIPATVIALRAAAGAPHPADVVGPTLLASCCTTVVAIASAKLLSRTALARSPEEA
jgi:spore maturation protein A